MTNAGKSYGEVDYAAERSKIETRLAQIPHAEISDLQKRLHVLQITQVRSMLAALKDIYPDLKAVLLVRDHGSELFTDLDLTNYEALIEDDRLRGKFPFSKGFCVPEGEKW
jgi:hypothetical protein